MKKKKLDEGLNKNQLSDPAEIIRKGRKMRDVQLFMAGLGEKGLLEIANKHGQSWNAMSEDEREQFIGNLLYEKSEQ